MRKRSRRWLWFAGGVVAGTALGWLTAPRRGDWVRNQIRQKAERWRRVGRIRLVKRGRDLENRLRGSVSQVRQAWTGHEHYVDANTLVDQVHTELGRTFSGNLAHVNLNAYGHTVYLHGYVQSAEERNRLIDAVGAVDGVDAVAAAELRVVAPWEQPAAGHNSAVAPLPSEAPASLPPPSEHAVPPRRPPGAIRRNSKKR